MNENNSDFLKSNYSKFDVVTGDSAESLILSINKKYVQTKFNMYAQHRENEENLQYQSRNVLRIYNIFILPIPLIIIFQTFSTLFSSVIYHTQNYNLLLFYFLFFLKKKTKMKIIHEKGRKINQEP